MTILVEVYLLKGSWSWRDQFLKAACNGNGWLSVYSRLCELQQLAARNSRIQLSLWRNISTSLCPVTPLKLLLDWALWKLSWECVRNLSRNRLNSMSCQSYNNWGGQDGFCHVLSWLCSLMYCISLSSCPFFVQQLLWQDTAASPRRKPSRAEALHWPREHGQEPLELEASRWWRKSAYSAGSPMVSTAMLALQWHNGAVCRMSFPGGAPAGRGWAQIRSPSQLGGPKRFLC